MTLLLIAASAWWKVEQISESQVLSKFMGGYPCFLSASFQLSEDPVL